MDKKILAAIVGVWLSLGFISTPSMGSEKIRLGLASLSAIRGDVWVASEKGFFKEYDLEPEGIYIQGSASAISALIAGDIQFLAVDGAAPISAALKGADVIIVAAALNQGIQRLVARAELKSPSDLEGKKVGITRVGAASYTVLRIMLRMWGIPADKVTVIQVGSSPAMLASLDKGGIDAAVLTVPSFFVAEDRGYRVLGDAVAMGINTLHDTVAVRGEYLRTHRDQTTRFLKAYIEGIAYFRKNKKEGLEVLKKKLRVGAGGEKYLERSYELLARSYDRVPNPSLEGVKTVLEFLGKDNPKAKGADPRSFIDDSIVREIEANGFIKALYEK